jgi:hypothetical protein
MTLCWWCCHSFENESLHLPHKYDDRRDKFHTMGHFCSFSCMKSFNLDNFSQHKAGRIGINITLMIKKCNDNKIQYIKAAPSKYSLKAFGGSLSIEEFRKNDKQIKTILPCQNTIFIDVVTRVDFPTTTSTTKEDSTKKLNDINNATHQNQPLKLKREKPLKRNQNNLANIFC